MGRAKHEMQEFEDRGLPMPTHKNVCSHHFLNTDLQRFVLENGNWGCCEYCSSPRRKVVDNGTLIKFMADQVARFYDSADNEGICFETAEGGYQGPTLDGEEMLKDCDFDVDDNKLRDEIHRCFSDQIWCRINPFDPSEREVLRSDWEKFATTVKHRSRYFFEQSNVAKSYYGSQISKILDVIGHYCVNLNLISSINTRNKIYRCRQHTFVKEIKTATDITSPPDYACNFSNRMSPAGISMFYGAFDKKTCISETIDNSDAKKRYYTIGVFTPVKPIPILDLSKVPKADSIFSEEWGKFYYGILFILDFIKNLSKDIARDGREHIEYVPTQIVTEYFKHAFREKFQISVDGILYPSSKNKGRHALVLFWDNKESLSYLQYHDLLQDTKKLRRNNH